MSNSAAKACLDSFFLANKKLQTASRMLSQSESLGQPRILIPVFEYVHQAMHEAMGSLIQADHALRIAKHEVHAHHEMPESFEHRLHALVPIAERFGLSDAFLRLLNDLSRIESSHRKSPVEFVRKGTIVICSQAYSVETLTKARLEEMIADAKKALFEIYTIIKDDRALAGALPLAVSAQH